MQPAADAPVRAGHPTFRHAHVQLDAHHDSPRQKGAPATSRRKPDVHDVAVGRAAARGRLRRNHGPEQITGLPFVANAALKTPETWTFSRTGDIKTEVTVNAAIRLDTTLAVREAVCQGGGLSVLPDYAVATEAVRRHAA